ncbi:probable serine/threonine-protein kinase clkA [Fopius arisanus]|uniref:Probable serine/threonine-protein kinase clkA n=1 Tax=Fopius arisanus TaxID=64838 RepID=A0A0C9PPR9_9HYME|nr:PREDICTED: probable serine/threonine-protein kinase clkA [Fopius arisanus]
MSVSNVILFSFAGILWSCVLGLQRPAPRYSQQFMPETSFTCRNKIVGSYYADPETDCQLFHVCASVAGVVQDYKFLCPNDTAFDQESQTCADWYDVDCEAATLYYASDNFDLYRLGSGLESVHYDSLRSDAEPQDHLQRSESNDPVRSAANSLNRVSPTFASQSNSNNRDILRGSSSSNYYNSRNNVKDDDYDSEKSYQDEPIVEPKKKPGVRKIARKQQYSNNNNNDAPSSTLAPSSTTNYNAYNNRNYYNHRTTYDTTTTARPTQDYSNDNSNYNRNYYNHQRTTYETTTTARPTSDYNGNQRSQNQNAQKYAAPSTFRPPTTQQYSTYQAPSTTARTTSNNNYNQQNTNYQTVSTTVKPFTFSQNYQHGTSPRPTTYNQNYQDNFSSSNGQYNNQKGQYNQGSRAQPTTVAPSTNYQQTDLTGFQQRNYNNIQRSTTAFPSTTTASTFYDAYSANNQFTGKTNGVTKQNAQTTNNKYQSFSTGIYVPTTYAPITKKVNEGSGRGGDRYNGQDSNGQFSDKPVKPAPFFDVTKAPKKVTQYNNYDNTAKYFEASTTNYDFGRSASGIGFSPSSINLLAETPKTTTPVPRRNGSPTTYNPVSFNGNNQRGTQQQTTRSSTHSSSARPFSTTAKFTDATTPRPKAPKKNDYDYAYYDNAGTLEYDGLDLEHVAGGKESAKIARN